MDFSNNVSIEPDIHELLKRVVSGDLSLEDERALEVLLAEKIELQHLLDELIGHYDELKAIGNLSNPSLSKSPALEHAMASLIDNGCRDRVQPATCQMDALAPIVALENIALVRKLGQGGMGVVYEGFDRHLGRAVAIKFMASELRNDANAQKRLLGEAQAAAQIQHENVVAIHSIQLAGELPYIVQQYVRGESLGQRLDRLGRLDADELIELTMQMARGLAAAHRIGLVHRDLKPDNVLIDDESNIARIADFGLAMRQGPQITAGDEFIAGTPAYMSPEQTRGAPLDVRSDLFSLGCLLYRAAAGKNPFEASDAATVMELIRNTSHAPLDSIRSDLPPIWLQSVHRLLEKEPGDRLQTATALIRLLTPLGIAKRRHPTAIAIPIAMFVIGILMTLSLMILNAASSNKERLDNSARRAEQSQPIVDSRIWFEVLGDSMQHKTLEAAISAASSAGTIQVHGIGVVNCGSIRLKGKSITLKMAADANVILCPRALPAGVKEPFIRTDSALSMINLRIESDRRGDFELPIQSIIESTNGPLHIQQCKISGRSFAACVVVSSGDVKIIDSQLASPEGPVLVGPQSSANVAIRNCTLEGVACLSISSHTSEPLEPSASYALTKCSLFGKSVLRVYLGRQPFIPIRFQLVDSIDTCEYQALFTTFFPRRDNLKNASEMVGIMKETLHWEESHCVHQDRVRSLGSVAVLPSSAVPNSYLSDWNAWANFWGIRTEKSLLTLLQVQRNEFSMCVDRSNLPGSFIECGATNSR